MTALLFAAAIAVVSADAAVLRNVRERDGAWLLGPGCNVEGVALVHQGDWPREVIQAFHDVPWLDAASVRLRWAELEPRDQVFRWEPCEKVLAEVKRYHAEHPSVRRTLHVRVMGGVHCPKWFERAGVRYYDTYDQRGLTLTKPMRTVLPYDNPEFLEQLREVYRAMVEQFGDEPLVTVYHGTWSAGPWDEIFHPQGKAPLPPDYTPEKFVQGMVAQLDVLLDELCLKGKVAELPYSGKYPSKRQIDVTGPLTARIVQKLGKRSPLVYIQSNGWGMKSDGQQTISWGHEQDIQDALGRVNLAFQALGTNAGGGWMPQGDWVRLVELAQQYQAAYVEIYPPDLMPLDTKHRIVEAFTQPRAARDAATSAESRRAGPQQDIPNFIGFRPWLAERKQVLYVREGTIRKNFRAGPEPRQIERVVVEASQPPGTWVKSGVRTRRADRGWTPWKDASEVEQIPAGVEAEVETTLHTDDGYVTPTVNKIDLFWK